VRSTNVARQRMSPTNAIAERHPELSIVPKYPKDSRR